MVIISKYSRQHPNGCRFCPKVFCCSECRDAHEDNKHPDPKCLMCHNQNQPFRFSKDCSDRLKDKLLQHIASNHLPVYCKLCGETYRTSEEFLSAKCCRGYSKHLIEKLAEKLATPQQQSKAQISLPSVNSSVTSARSNFGTPLHLTKEAANRSRIIASNKESERQDSLDSPPTGHEELVRQTSTPMHGNSELAILTLKSQVNVTKGASFKNAVYSPVTYDDGDKLKKVNPDLVPLKLNLSISGNSSREKASDIKKQSSTSWGTPIAILKKPGESILKFDLLGRIRNDSGAANNSNASSEKRVRFSDQLFSTPVRGDESSVPEIDMNVSNDLFFEAQENPMDSNNNSPVAKDKKSSDNKNNMNEENFGKVNDPPQSPTDAKDDPFEAKSPEAQKVEKPLEEPEKPKYEQVKKEKVIKIQLEDPEDEKIVLKDEGEEIEDVADTKENQDANKSTSRVVMMLLVEQTEKAASDLTAMDLRPIIDSGLQALESISPINAIKGDECPFVNGDRGRRRNSNSWCISPETQSSAPARSQSIAEFPFSSTTTSKTEIDQQTIVHGRLQKPEKETGLLSAMARAVRNALTKIPGSLTTRNLAREPLSSPYETRVTRKSSLSTSTEVLIVKPSTPTADPKNPSKNSNKDLGKNLNKTPGNNIQSMKRRRSEDILGFAHQDLPSGGNSSNSPEHKRYRAGWYRIKAREPLYRMRDSESSSNSELTDSQDKNQNSDAGANCTDHAVNARIICKKKTPGN